MSSDLAPFRDQIRTWLAEHVDPHWREKMFNVSQEAFVDAQRAWFEKLSGAGLATPHWPADFPGGGRSLAEQKIIYEELARADAPRLILYFLSLYHAACTLIECGSEAQKREFLPAIASGQIWCQGFSEPNAGSDLANIKTRAERQGDVYVVNGQKIWSTMAQYADRCLLLARSSRESAPQAGLTYLLVDMKTPGISVRPIHQVTGDDEFSEIFFDDVQVPVTDRIGEEGQGWGIAQATLASERGLTLVELSLRMQQALPRLKAAVLARDPRVDGPLMWTYAEVATEVAAAVATADQYLQNRIAGHEGLGDASVVKLVYSRTLRRFVKLGLQVSGLQGQYHRGFMRGAPQETGHWLQDFLNSYNWTIAGGSDEVQRNIIAERMLGMPREPKHWLLEKGDV
jgi:alkylation response protein AidB-like acyl-CoA dehydrogenase